MHGLDSSIPPFHTRVRGTLIVITPELVSNVLLIPMVEHPDYPSCERLDDWGAIIILHHVRPLLNFLDS